MALTMIGFAEQLVLFRKLLQNTRNVLAGLLC